MADEAAREALRKAARTALRRRVSRALIDPAFNRRLANGAPEKQSRPVVIGLRDDHLTDIVREVMTVGGSAVVVMPYLDAPQDLAVLPLSVGSAAPRDAGGQPAVVDLIREQCTLGLFLQRLLSDQPGGGEVTYAFKIAPAERSEDGPPSFVEVGA